MKLFKARPSRRALIGSLVAALAVIGVTASFAAGPAPAGRAVMAWHVTISPAWFDPSTAPPQITPFGMLYAIHDALVRPYPGQKMGPALAESWEESEDGLTHEFKLRAGLTFHNGDPLTTEDVKFSFERYQGAGASILKERVREVEIIDPRVVRFHLKEPWPDFMTFYGTTATAAGIVVPKKYLTAVGDDGFKQHPVGAGPYKFVSSKPGIEVQLAAFPGYWRHVPKIETLVMRSVPDATTRALMLRSGEADMAYALDGVDAEGIRNDPSLKVVATKHASSQWIEFTEHGIPNRHGTTSGCGSRSTPPSTVKGSARRHVSAFARRQA
jgi:peptide/nickel transport system substrate-binding protein